MADFDNVTVSAPVADYEAGVLKWLQEAVSEGEAILKDEPAFDEMEKSIAYIMGEQGDTRRSAALSNIVDNRLKTILNQTVAALTDIHPLFGFHTYNNSFKDQESVLMKLAQAWWINNFSDLKLADVIKFAAGAGTGYCEVAWDASAYNGTGDIVLRPIDPRNVLPIRPSLGGSLQDWDGVIIRSAKTPEELQARYPDKAGKITSDRAPSITTRSWTRAKRLYSAIITPSAVDNLTASNPRNMPRKVATTDVYTIYLKDRSLHLGPNPVVMGDPETTWSYTVYPVGYDKVPNGFGVFGEPIYRQATIKDSKKYPRGRMIVATKNCVLYDGPNPYWHGMFPVSRLSLDPWPWALLGLGLAHDLIPIQDALNETLNGIMDHVRKLLKPAIVADKKSVSNNLWERIDTRLPGLRIKTNAAAGKGLEFVSPEPLPQYTFDVLQFLTNELDYHAGTANLIALTQVQQIPGDDTIERMTEALTPTLRLKGRLLEYFLRDVGEMVKSNFFQFYNLPRRVAMLGEAGISFDDFDFDPGSMVPAMSNEDPGYMPELDKRLGRADRAQWMQKNFAFQITPNSLLAISQISRKMMYLQLRREGLIDRWTLYDIMEIPNGGTPPGNAETITDRLMAEQAIFMGGMMAQGQQGPGRPPSGQQPPSMQQKKDEGGVPRQTVSESGSGGG